MDTSLVHSSHRQPGWYTAAWYTSAQTAAWYTNSNLVNRRQPGAPTAAWAGTQTAVRHADKQQPDARKATWCGVLKTLPSALKA